MGFYMPLSCTEQFKKRLLEHFPNRDASKWLVDLANSEMDKLDGITAINTMRQKWFSRTVKPAVHDYAGDGDLFPLRTSKKLFRHLNDKGIEITEIDLCLCIEEMMQEAENG
jgi:Uri superfamily endonuclease